LLDAFTRVYESLHRTLADLTEAELIKEPHPPLRFSGQPLQKTNACSVPQTFKLAPALPQRPDQSAKDLPRKITGVDLNRLPHAELFRLRRTTPRAAAPLSNPHSRN
jgi:hypothetical protein